MDTSEKNTLIVCEVCGSSNIQEMGWVDPNTNTVVSYADMVCQEDGVTDAMRIPLSAPCLIIIRNAS